MEANNETILELRDTYVHYQTVDHDVNAVNGVSLTLRKGEALGLVGETGAGKTTLALAIMGLLPQGIGEVYKGSIWFKGKDMSRLSKAEMRDIRGNQIGMIFQDPMTSLNPIFTVGDQIEEVLRLHHVPAAEIDARVDEILTLVGISPERKVCYPHQFSGGMKQRIVIAMALACQPDLLIADEPTTALDVTIQAQVLAMIGELQQKFGTSLIMVTHDFGVVAETCDKVAIMYAGEIVEYGTLEQVFDRSLPHHPYTEGLFGCIPDLNNAQKRLNPIPGITPDPSDLPEGCYFSPRCARCTESCRRRAAQARRFPNGQVIKCHLFDETE